MYGSPDGIDTGDSATFNTFDNFTEEAEETEYFGQTLAVGDFDGDGYDDLAIGAPGRDDVDGDREMVGKVFVLFGSAAGLDDAGAVSFDESHPAIASDPDELDAFGHGLAAGDFDGDGFADLAVGAPGNDVDGVSSAGLVHIISGSANGLDLDTTVSLHQGSPGVPGALEPDSFGATLTAGDFDGDGTDDLAVQSRTESIGNVRAAGLVHVFLGGPMGIEGARSRAISQATAGVAGVPEFGDQFGTALVPVDLDGDGYDDLVVGTPGESIGDQEDAGMLHVLFGDAGGIRTDTSVHIHEATPGVIGVAFDGDEFAAALAAADFDGDGVPDLVVGVPGGGVGHGSGAPGTVHVLVGDDSERFDAPSDLPIYRARPELDGTNEAQDRFGHAVATGDLDGDGVGEIVIGNPGAGVGGAPRAGMVHVVEDRTITAPSGSG